MEKLQKKAELIEKWLAENQPKQGAAGREKQSNITDNDSATMMTSHGVVQGYNSQALIDAKHQVIVHGEAFGNGQDHGHIPPMLTGALENLQSLGHEPDYFKGKALTADSNYHTQVNLKECQELGLDAYIPDRKFRNRDPRFDSLGLKVLSEILSRFMTDPYSYRAEWPDLTIIKDNHFTLIEVKTNDALHDSQLSIIKDFIQQHSLPFFVLQIVKAPGPIVNSAVYRLFPAPCH